MEKNLLEPPSSPWDQAALENDDSWTREYNAESAVVEAEQFAQQMRRSIVRASVVLEGIFVLLSTIYGGILVVFGRSPFLVPDHGAMFVSHVVAFAALFAIVVIALRCILLSWAIKYASTTTSDRFKWIMNAVKYCTLLLMLLYGASSLLLLLLWNALHLESIRSFLDPQVLHTHWMIPLPWARSIQGHFNQLYLPLLVLCLIEAIRYFAGLYSHALSAATDTLVDSNAQPPSNTYSDDPLRAPLLSSSSSLTARWWNSDFWTTTPPHRSADLTRLHDAWAMRSELEGPLWWSRDEEDIVRDLPSTSPRPGD